jgi:tetratricopeptide (TPR) repeat protein
MDAVTYPDDNVSEFVMKNVVPLRALSNAEPLATDFNIKWTPTLITLDANGKEHYRTVGFLPPDEMIPSLLLGIGKTHFELDAFAEAIACFDKIIAEYPKSGPAPEAMFFRGVCGYKSTHTAGPLKEAYEKLTAQYPQSEWAKRALPYRLL